MHTEVSEGGRMLTGLALAAMMGLVLIYVFFGEPRLLGVFSVGESKAVTALLFWSGYWGWTKLSEDE